MTIFDQRGQTVTHQYNAAGDINFGNLTSRKDVATEMQKLVQEVDKAVKVGQLDQETAVEVEFKLKKAALQTQEPNPDKNRILLYLREAKALLEEAGSVAGIVKGLAQAIVVIVGLF